MAINTGLLNTCKPYLSNISKVMRKIDDLITTEFLPAIKGEVMCSTERLLALAQILGHLGKPLFSEISHIKYENSKLLTKITCEIIISEDREDQLGQEIKKIKSKLAKN